MDYRIRQLINSLPLADKVGQLFMLAIAGPDLGWARTLIEQLQIGGFYLTDDNARTPAAALAFNQQLQHLAALRSVDAPLLLAVDQEGAWGILTQWTDTGPGNLALGQLDEPVITAAMYRCFAGQMQALGYNTILAPCADVNSNPDNPIIGQRAFGAEPALVSRHVQAACQALTQAQMLACAKHFPGHGDTATDSHNGLPVVALDRAALLDSHLQPFIAAIEAQVPLIMTSHICYPQLDPQWPATLSPAILTGLLREQLGYRGVILTDSMNMGAMRRHYDPVVAAVQALHAGADMIMLSEEHYENAHTDYQAIQRQTIEGVIAAVQRGELAESRLDEALGRVLQLRYQLNPTPAAHAPLQIPDGSALAATAAWRACKILRNQAGLLPLRQPFYLCPLAEPDEYEQICNSRGIGPNDPTPAATAFVAALQQLAATFTALNFSALQQQLQQGWRPDKPLVLLSEDYPLPGSRLDLNRQLQRANALIATLGDQVVLVGLRSDHELSHLPALASYLCSYSSRRCAANAAAGWLIGATAPAQPVRVGASGPNAAASTAIP